LASWTAAVPTAPAAPVDQHCRTRGDFGLLQEAASGEPAEDQRHSVLERHVRRLERDRVTLPQHGVLRVAAEPGAQHGDDLVAGLVPGDVRADGFDDARDVHPQHRALRPEDTESERSEQPQPAGDVATAGAVVGGADGARAHPDEDIAPAHRRPRELLHPNQVRATEPAVDRGPHLRACAEVRVRAGPVRAEEAGDLAGPDGEADAVDGGLRAVGLGEVLSSDHDDS